MDTLPVINLTYEIYKIVVDMVNHMEKRWRYSLGIELEKTILALLGRLIMAKNAPKPLKAPYLIEASSHLEIATLKLRLFLELGIANETKIFQTQKKLALTGQQLGGWLKSLN